MKRLLIFCKEILTLPAPKRLGRVDYFKYGIACRLMIGVPLCILYFLIKHPMGLDKLLPSTHALTLQNGLCFLALFIIVVFGLIYYCMTAATALCVTIARLHDFDMSGWWLVGLFFVGILMPEPKTLQDYWYAFLALELALLFLPGSSKENKYGPVPIE